LNKTRWTVQQRQSHRITRETAESSQQQQEIKKKIDQSHNKKEKKKERQRVRTKQERRRCTNGELRYILLLKGRTLGNIEELKILLNHRVGPSFPMK
jgi:hypothetical protein